MFKLLGIIGSGIIAWAVFYLFFYIFAPFLISFAPNNEWLIIYCLVAYAGGIMLPISIFVGGVLLSLYCL